MNWPAWREHATALLAAAPLGVVRLTTWPETENGWRNGTARLVDCETFRSTRGLVAEADLVPMLLRAEYARNGRPRFELPGGDGSGFLTANEVRAANAPTRCATF